MIKTTSTIGSILVIAATATVTQAGDEPANAGVVVRLYDIGESMRGLPSIARGELPNVVRVVLTIDLQSANGAFDPLRDNFMTEVLGFVRITEPGKYIFRLISDDGAMLWIDGRLVVDHDGLHGPVPKDGATELTEGEHSLRILHFEAGGGEALSLQWQTPAMGSDADFVLMPGDVLTHDSGIPEATSDGRKRVIMPLRRGLPGDGSPLIDIHPSFAYFHHELEGISDQSKRKANSCEDLRIRIQCPSGRGSSLVLLPPVGDSGGEIEHGTLRGAYYGDSDASIVRTVLDNCLCLEPHIVSVEDRNELYRLVPERVEGYLQGCVFRFMGGFKERIAETSNSDVRGVPPWMEVNRTPDGSTRTTIHTIGLTGRETFEMSAVRALTNGLEVEFSKPLDVRVGWEADSYHVEQWPFDVETGQSPYRDGVRYPVQAAHVSRDRKRVFLKMDSLKTSHLIYLRLLPPCLSEDGELPWTTEAWYTLNVVPKDRPGKRLPGPSMRPRNFLTAQERSEGWRLLFDGRTTKGWRGYGKDEFPSGWEVKNGCLVRVGPGGDIMTDEEFDDFELTIDWRISAGGNSGVFYRVNGEMSYPWHTGPEMQVLDNREHFDGRNAKTSAGSNYALHAPVRDVTEPVGLFNRSRIVVQGDHVEHWLNGVKIVEYDLGSAEWNQRVAESKFASMPNYGRMSKGHIVLQDHGDKVWYMNIKIRGITG
ncbi:MAG: DUF1080 domain-containing protein [Planctomycetes bacterium]|nr:DUF1080 domain-containing protein [Planctomycetota bacterium]